MIIFDEPATAYHASPAIGSSDVRAFLRSPRLFRDRLDGLAQRETAALLFGTVSHLRLLEPERYRAGVAVKPDGMSFATKEGKAWRDEQRRADRLIVSHEDAQHLTRMHMRMPAEVRAILARCRTEVTYRTAIDDLLVQCRFDLSGNGESYDLKTIDDMDQVERAIYRYGYHVAQRWYQRVEEAETLSKPRPFRFIFAEKQPPYRWRIVSLDVDYQMTADQQIDDALHGIAARTESGCWDDDCLHMVVSPPAWLSPEIEDEEI